MPLDTFICGTCMCTFNSIEQFILHKKVCERKDGAGGSLQTTETVTVSLDEATDAVNTISQLSAGTPVELEVTDESFLSNALLESDVNSDQPQTIIVLQGDIPTLANLPDGLTELGVAQAVAPSTDKTTPAPQKRRGRPKKVQKLSEVKPEPLRTSPERSKDGKFLCTRCKRSFTKERFFKTHKCLASSGYVDMSHRDVKLDSGDEETVAEEFEDVGAMDVDDNDVDYTTPEEDMSGSQTNIKKVEVQADPDVDSSHMEKATDVIKDIPIFRNDEEKHAFEQTMNADLSVVDDMFRVHMIVQDLNEHAKSGSRMTNNSLSLYSCNVCDKVFKTLSHMRLHCLIHTNLKPFKCPKCNFSSNCRGNLYTHMRKHTGQFYKCDRCTFRTVNKSHLLEHESTHSNERHLCELCKKDYNTHKSLINHVRKYHTTPKGKLYLQSFLQGREVRGSTVIHQCHVCNRKFKKKIDRDRHLFVHDIRDIPNIQHCELCDYSSSRKVYLEKHFQKHRCIYRCCRCDEKFLSSLRLIEHLTNAHIKSDKWEMLFEESINNSVYLPEPDESLVGSEKELVNLPPELRESNLNLERQLSRQSGEEEMRHSEMNSGDRFINKVLEPCTASAELEDKASREETVVKSEHTLVKTDGTEADTGSAESMEVDSADNSSFSDPTALAQGLTSEGAVETLAADTEEILDDEEEGDPDRSERGQDLIKRLGYLPMTMQIFQKMRDTFGNEECEFCGRLFFSKVDYEPHVRTHTGDKPHVCSRCGYRAITKDNLKRHTDKEHDNINFPCNDCDFVALSRTQLWNHQMKHRGLKGLECPECQEQFESIKELRSHAIMKHPASSRDEINKITGYKHKMQGKMGRRSYKCPHCDKVFFRAQAELQKHIWIHEGIKPFKCPICPHACRSKNNLQAHMLRHSKDKPFMCTDCGKAYKSKTALRWHVRAHNDGKLFKCDKCPYEGSQRSHLKRHMETHDIMKRFVCAHCDFSANTLGYLKIHYTRYHKGLELSDIPSITNDAEKNQKREPNIYKCLSCDYLFGNLSDLKRHLKVRHHVQVQDMQTLEGPSNVSEVQVLQYEQSAEDEVVTTSEPAVTVQSQPAATDDSSLDEKTASAVNILQHIIGMSQQGAFSQQQQVITDGQAANSDTIIVQQDVEEVLVTNGEAGLDSGQYVIQYVTPQDGQQINELSLVEVQTDTDPADPQQEETLILQGEATSQVMSPVVQGETTKIEQVLTRETTVLPGEIVLQGEATVLQEVSGVLQGETTVLSHDGGVLPEGATVLEVSHMQEVGQE